MSYEVKQQIDARGSFCPGPLMELVRVIKEIEIGEVIDLLSSDEGSVTDIPKWVEKAGHEMMEVKEEEDFRHFIVKKGEKVRKRRKRNR
ncbi:MAG: sulfurtransferase TusA family protein [Candidatus Kariarchaeaceae archaeon]|jgi:TusA-related sulfurtransferase